MTIHFEQYPEKDGTLKPLTLFFITRLNQNILSSGFDRSSKTLVKTQSYDIDKEGLWPQIEQVDRASRTNIFTFCVCSLILHNTTY